MEDVGDQEQKSTVESVERKDWSLSYPNLEYLSSFTNFVTSLIRLGLVVKPWVQILDAGHCNRHLSSINQTNTFTFWLTPPLKRSSSVDLGEFFGQAGLYQLGPTFYLFVSIHYDLYYVYKVASVRLDLL